MDAVKTMAILDRYEGDTAVLLLGPENKQVLWPQKLLPKGSKEGQIFTVVLTADHLATELARREAAALLQEIIAENEQPGGRK